MLSTDAEDLQGNQSMLISRYQSTYPTAYRMATPSILNLWILLYP